MRIFNLYKYNIQIKKDFLNIIRQIKRPEGRRF